MISDVVETERLCAIQMENSDGQCLLYYLSWSRGELVAAFKLVHPMHQCNPHALGAVYGYICTMRLRVEERSMREQGPELAVESGCEDMCIFKFRCLYSVYCLPPVAVNTLSLPHSHPQIQILTHRTSCQVYTQTVTCKDYSNANHALNHLLCADSTSIASPFLKLLPRLTTSKSPSENPHETIPLCLLLVRICPAE